MTGNTKSQTRQRPVRWNPSRIREAGLRLTDRVTPNSTTPTGPDGQLATRTRPDVVGTLATEQLDRDLIDLAAHLASGTYELLVLVGEYDARNTWALRGALSCAAWLADLCDIEISTARTQVGVARAVRDHPLLDAALAHGDISYSKARRLVPYLNGDNDQELLDIARRTPAGRLGAAIAAWTHRNDDDQVIEQRQRDSRFCSWRTNPDGTITLTAQLTPAAAGAVCAVIDTWVTTHQPVTEPNKPNGGFFPDAPADSSGAEADASADQPHTETDPYPTLGQQRIIDQRHPQCTHPGCNAHTFLQYDRPYTRGGLTVVANLQRLCGPHNRAKATNPAASPGQTPERFSRGPSHPPGAVVAVRP